MNAPAELPLAVEVLTLAAHRDYDFLRGYLAGKTDAELIETIVCLSVMCSGALDAAYSDPEGGWLPNVCQALLDQKATS